MSDTITEAPAKAVGMLNKKVAGIPVWVIGAIVVLAAVLYYRHRMATQSANTNGTSADATPSDATSMAGGDVTSSGEYAGSPIDTGSSTTTSTVSSSGFATNGEWSSAAAEGLIAQGMSAASVNNALSAYLGGSQLTPDQITIVQSAIALYGEPPAGILPINAAPVTVSTPVATDSGTTSTSGSSTPSTPAKTTTPAKPTTKTPPKSTSTTKTAAKKPTTTYSTYTIKKGDTLTSIARKYYGSATPDEINAIAKASGISNPNLIVAGHKVKVPHVSGSMGHYKE